MLITTLAALNLSNSVADLDANLKRLDKRFIGVYGYSCCAPGTGDADWHLVQSMAYGLRCLAGTGDIIESDQDKVLMDKAWKYALTYNTELLRRIRAGLIKA